MKNLLSITLVIALSITGLYAQDAKTTTISTTNKTPAKIEKEVKKGKALLVDVRTPEEYNVGHLKYAKNIDYKAPDFKKNISGLDKNKTVYLYCRSGNRSGKAADTLKTLGYSSYYNIGGFEQLKSAGLPVE